MPGVGSNPNWPDLRVFVDFTNPGANNTYTWTDITQWCRRLGNGQLAHIERGRNYERAQTDSGTCNIIVDNSTGVFDPENAASPYYPNVKPIRKIKVEAAWQIANSLPASAQNFEDGTTGGWVNFAGSSIANSVAIAHSGTHSLAVTIPGANVNNFVAYSPYETQASVVGRTYTASIWVWSNTGFTGRARLQHDNYAQTSTLAFELGASTVVAANTWTQLTVTGTVPAGGGWDRVELFVSANAAGQVIYIDDAVISGYGIYPLFQGRVEDWPRTWTKSGFYGEVLITAKGVLSSLSTVTLLPAWVNQAITDGAQAIYRLDDRSGSVAAANSSSTSQAYALIKATSFCTASSKYDFGSVGGGAGNLAGDDSGGMTLTPEVAASNKAGYYLQTAIGNDASAGLLFPATGGWSWECWFQTSVGATAAGLPVRALLGQVDGGGANMIWIELLTSNVLEFLVSNSNGSVTAIADSSVNVVDGAWHHLVVTFGTDSKTATIYVDTVATTNVAASAISFSGFTNTPYTQVVGAASKTFGCWSGTIKNCAWYIGTVLTPTQVANHYNAGRGNPGDDTGTRISRILGYAPYPLTALDTGNSLLGGQPLGGKNVVAAIEEANDTEVGTVWERGDGYVVFTSRHGRGGTTALATFGEAGFPYEDGIILQQDPREIFTNVIVNRNNGLTINNTDVAATGDFFPRTMTINSFDNTDAQAVDLSNYQLNRYKVPRTRIPNLTLRPSANPALWTQVLDREIGDRITVTRNNPGAPSISGDFYIEKITHDIQVGEWKTTWMLSSASLFDYWILGDATFSVLGSTTQLSF